MNCRYAFCRVAKHAVSAERNGRGRARICRLFRRSFIFGGNWFLNYGGFAVVQFENSGADHFALATANADIMVNKCFHVFAPKKESGLDALIKDKALSPDRQVN